MGDILLVEPDRNQRMLLAELLEEGGHYVSAVATADEALLHLQEQAPDLVILEVVLPGMQGSFLLGRLLETSARLPVIVHSVAADDLGGSAAALVDACVVKSSDPTRLAQAVERVLRRRPLVSASRRCPDSSLRIGSAGSCF